MRQPSRAIWAMALLVLVLSAAGCVKAAESPEAKPAAETTVVEGSEIERITLTEDAVHAVGIETQPVGVDRLSPLLRVIPLTALIYDPEGKPWTYTLTAPRSYLREPVVIARIAGANVYLSDGPAVGTQVVTVGASELLGVEYGVGAE
jgi:hypothetical protein